MPHWSVGEPNWLYPSLGVAACAISAALLCIAFRNSASNTALPLYFLAIILFIATRFGVLAGTLGTIFAEAIFAMFLFEPLYSVAVQNQAARDNLLWMFLGGLALSDLFGHHPTDTHPPHAQ
jgi:K+-sensing histidine kinase KdpD